MASNELKYKKRDDASARLGEKMLQGWTLLGLTCPNDGCLTPFVRNKQGQMYCVNCEMFAVTEEDAKKEREKEQQEQEGQQLAVQLQEEKEREQRIAQRFREEEQRRAAARQQKEYEQQQVRAAASAAAVAMTPGKRKGASVPLDDGVTSPDNDRMKTLRHQTLAALYQKMEDLTNSLSAQDHSERMLTVAKTIRELAEAIQTLSSTS
uniref:Uncharacterized protein n=1 Tax=Globisporangium ultimum (strain ATCC 200006 / CBS 805.95 / DAOM BR144) TaxID=431595 RepID=K3WG22_GLOUD